MEAKRKILTWAPQMNCKRETFGFVLVTFGSNPDPATLWLYNLRQVTSPLCTSFFSSAKWEPQKHIPQKVVVSIKYVNICEMGKVWLD